MFNKYIKKKVRQEYQLLIIDRHSYSHMNLLFLNYVERHQIIVLILPPHSSHRLQLLDVGLVLPLNKAYSKKLLDFMIKGQSFINISKRMFYPFFKKA